eukprot:TRINITY_DN7497_c0_g1_i1.p3 TRINITY_DN7497_c0_g1~~TRINITY_DN7497_c0_g1_i1.p3  ORF type:complete len:104 (-),score=31.08 TRINITY_DN7497_c0_g1_i1:54-365(-)
MIRRPPRSTHCISSAASDVYKRQLDMQQSQQDAQRERQEKTKRRRRFDKMLETIGQSCLTSLGAVVDSKNNPIDSYIDNKSEEKNKITTGCLLYTSPSPRDQA